MSMCTAPTGGRRTLQLRRGLPTMAASPEHGSPMNPSFAYLRRSRHVIRAAFVVSVVFAAPVMAQSSGPLPELLAAQEAVDRATQADADQYAPDMLQLARDELAQAQAAAADRRERKRAPVLAQRATADADLARVRSEEATASARLQQRQDEIAGLRRQLGLEERP